MAKIPTNVLVVGGNASMHNATAGNSIPGEVMLVMLVKYSGESGVGAVAPTQTRSSPGALS